MFRSVGKKQGLAPEDIAKISNEPPKNAQKKRHFRAVLFFYIAPYNTAVASAVDVISTLETVAY